MNQDTSKERALLEEFLRVRAQEPGIQVRGKWRFTITRADGSMEEQECANIVTKDGLNAIAELLLGDATGANSAFKYLVVGTQTAAASLGSVQGGIGEVDRKIGSTIASSNEVAVIVATWAGAADSITGVVLRSAGVANHVSSGLGILGNAVNSVDATLQDSDFLRVQMEIQIGSHAL